MARPAFFRATWLRLGFGIASGVLAMLVLGVAIRHWLPTDGGRALVVNLLDGRRVGALGTLRIERMTGDPLSDFGLADIALVDDHDVWLRAKDVRVAWRVRPLLSGSLQIETLAAREVSILRVPDVADKARRPRGSDLSLRIADARIDTIDLSELALGVTRPLQMTGAMRISPGTDSEARLELHARDNTSDGARLRLAGTADGHLTATLTAEGPADGVLAALLRSPDRKAPSLTASLDGALAQLTGSARLSFGNDTAAILAVSRAADHLAWSGRIEPTGWPLLADAALLSGGAMDLAGSATLVRNASVPFDLNVRMPAGLVSLGGRIGAQALGFDGPLDLSVAGLDLSRIADIRGLLTARGRFTPGANEGWSWSGDASLANVDVGLAAARTAEGPLSIERHGNRISWRSDGLALTAARSSLLRTLPPGDYRLAAQGDYSLRDRKVEVIRSQLDGAIGRITAQGDWALRGGGLDLSGAADLRDLAGLGGLRGAASGRWAASRAGRDAPIRVRVDAQGEAVRASSGAVQQVLGSSPRVRLSVLVQRGRTILESGSVSGGALEASLQGALVGEGALQGDIQGRLVRPVQLGGVSLDQGRMRGRLTGSLSAPRLSLAFSDGRARIPGETIDSLSGDLTATLGARTRGRIQLAGARADGSAVRMTAQGRLGRQLDIDRLWVGLGGLDVSVSDLRVSPGVAAASFEGEGDLAGVLGLAGGRLTTHGRFAMSRSDFTIEAAGAARDISVGRARLASADFNLRFGQGVALGDLRLLGSDPGLLDARLQLQGAGVGRTWSGNLDAAGQLAGLPLSSTEPLAWRLDQDSASLKGAIQALGGEISGGLSSGKDQAILLAWSSLDLAPMGRLLFANAVTGNAEGSLELRQSADGPPEGRLRLVLAGINPEGLTRDPVTLRLDSALAGNRLRTTVHGSGQGFVLNANADAGVTSGPGLMLGIAREQPLSARLELQGAIAPLWALMGPPGQSLRGIVTTDLTVQGTPEAPSLSGGLELSGGAYDHAASGLSLRDVRVAGAFDRNSLTLNQVSARDRGTGVLSGDGEMRWTGDLNGELRLAARALRVLGREDREAVVSGDARLLVTGRTSKATGTLILDQARFSVEQPTQERIPALPGLRRVNFEQTRTRSQAGSQWPPLALDLEIEAPRRTFVFGRGLDTEWSGRVRLTGTTEQPQVTGLARMTRGDLNLAGRRFAFDDGEVRFDGPLSSTRINLSARRDAADIDARATVSGPLSKLAIDLTSTPVLPRDEVLARVLFARSLAQLTPLEGAQLAAALNQLAGGQAAFDPAELLRGAVGLDRISLGAGADASVVSAGKYLTRDVYLEVGAGGEGGVAADVEWQPSEDISITSSARGNGDTRIAVRWKRDY